MEIIEILNATDGLAPLMEFSLNLGAPIAMDELKAFGEKLALGNKCDIVAL